MVIIVAYSNAPVLCTFYKKLENRMSKSESNDYLKISPWSYTGFNFFLFLHSLSK